MGGSTPEGLIAFFGAMVVMGLILAVTRLSDHGRAPGFGLTFVLIGGAAIAFYLKVFDGMLVPWKLAAWGAANVVLFGLIIRSIIVRRRGPPRS